MTPRLEVGLRRDDGDAETGFGLDLGGGLAWSDPARGLTAEVRGRGLLTHAAAGFRAQGFPGSLTWDPRLDSERGLSLTLGQTVGAAASGGMDALLGRNILAGLAANDDSDALQRRRLEGASATASPRSGTGSPRRRSSASGFRTPAATPIRESSTYFAHTATNSTLSFPSKPTAQGLLIGLGAEPMDRLRVGGGSARHFRVIGNHHSGKRPTCIESVGEQEGHGSEPQ